jgi:hypothetical protein
MQVTVLRTGAAQDLGQCRGIEVLDDGRLQAARVQLRDIVDLDVGESPGTVDPDELGVAVDLAARQRRTTRHPHRRDAAGGIVGRAAEHLEGNVPHRIGDLGQFQR